VNVTIPLCVGLTIATAISDPEGDYETLKTIEAVTPQTIDLKVSAQRRVQSVVRNLMVRRSVLRSDLASATLYMHWFNSAAPRSIPGSTALGTSTVVLRALKSAGSAQLGIVDASSSALRANPATHPNVYDYRVNYELKRVGNDAITVPVTVNDARVELPAIQAQGDYIGDKARFVFLDDERNPLTLAYEFGSTAAQTADAEGLRLQVVKISYRCSGEDATQSSGTSRLEQALLKSGRAEVYDIYFDFNSDHLREESEPTLQEIGALMQRHPDWKLRVEGHTDNVASDSYNLQLSQRRANAVTQALVAAHGVVAARLSAAGFGESRPKDRNDTLEGRARNRRVELVRE
jgi:outer membrane protein OmpA-like peptidoglycan-associated protein